MKISKRQLKRIIREEKRKLFETDYSSMSEDEIIDSLSNEDYAVLEGLAYTLADEISDATIGADEASYIVTLLLQKIFPEISNNPNLKKFIK